MDSLLALEADGRASLYERFWERATAEVKPEEYSVVGNRRARTLELCPRAKVRKLGGSAADCFSHHLMKNPSDRRPGKGQV